MEYGSCSLVGLFAGLDLAKLLDDSGPSCEAIAKVSESLDTIVNRETSLLHSMQLSDRDSVVIQRVIVDSDGEGDAALIGASVPLADRVGRIIDLA